MRDAVSAMDSMYRFQRHFYDMTRKPYLLGRDRLIAGLDVPAGGSVLEIGCGTGRNLVLIARRYPDAACYGLDVSRAMLKTASASIANAGLSSRIQIAFGDATSLDSAASFGMTTFERVVISYSLSMIADWEAVLDHAGLLVAPGGSLNIVDFGDQCAMPSWFKTTLFAWLRRFSVTPRIGLRARCEETARRCGGRCEFLHIYRGYAAVARISR